MLSGTGRPSPWSQRVRVRVGGRVSALWRCADGQQGPVRQVGDLEWRLVTPRPCRGVEFRSQRGSRARTLGRGEQVWRPRAAGRGLRPARGGGWEAVEGRLSLSVKSSDAQTSMHERTVRGEQARRHRLGLTDGAVHVAAALDALQRPDGACRLAATATRVPGDDGQLLNTSSRQDRCCNTESTSTACSCLRGGGCPARA